MINKDLKRLGRRELVEVIYQMKKNEQEMEEKMAALNTELQDKRIRLSMAGSIAEASMSVTNVFSAAQMTADIYLREITYMKEETEKECAQKIEDANKKVEAILAEGESRLAEIDAKCQAECKKLQQLEAEFKELSRRRDELGEDVSNG